MCLNALAAFTPLSYFMTFMLVSQCMSLQPVNPNKLALEALEEHQTRTDDAREDLPGH
jgi:hypothetical protein